MKTLHVFRILSVLLIVIGTLVFASPADAYLEKETIPIDNTFYLTKGIDSPCDFDLTIHDYGYLKSNTWREEDTMPTKRITTAGTLREDWIANGKVIHAQVQGPGIYTYTFDFENNLAYVNFKLLGTWDLITIPGYGKVGGGANLVLGTDVFKLPYWEYQYSVLEKEVGNWTPNDLEKICAYLAP